MELGEGKAVGAGNTVGGAIPVDVRVGVGDAGAVGELDGEPG
jgi:hypothetical protein